jgi:serine/threonine protein kinase
LGEGAVAVVYLAQQHQPVKRQVALKIIKPGMDSKTIVARFEAERQALALLDHPNIAQIHDAGTTEDRRPYFAMEYVDGLAITHYCDKHRLPVNERLHLFLLVCRAVHHAHQKGIIHRDIKPSNILVCIQNDEAVPKVIDFGLAKAVRGSLSERTLVTEQGQLLGTPEYMSPEQADMANQDVDIRSDIYSLGVLLYVLLTGVLPFDSASFRESGLEYIRQVICETDPKTPSTRLTGLGKEATKAAESRSTEVATLARCLRKELEWIPLKAMRKECAERYQSASELADDVENYLKGAPLIAGPPSTWYQVKKFVTRKKALVTGTVVVTVVLIVGIVVSTVFALGQLRARSEAERQERIAKD